MRINWKHGRELCKPHKPYKATGDYKTVRTRVLVGHSFDADGHGWFHFLHYDVGNKKNTDTFMFSDFELSTHMVPRGSLNWKKSFVVYKGVQP